MNWNLVARTFRLAFLLRVPVSMLLLLGALGPVAYNNSMISNLLDQSGSRWYLFTVSFSAFLLAFTCVTTLNLALLYGGERFDEGRHSGLSQKRPLLTFLIGCAAAVLLDFYIYRRTRPVEAWNILFLALGFIASFGLVIGAKLIQLALSDPKTTPHPPPYLIFPAYIFAPAERLFDKVYCWSSSESKAVKGVFNRLSQWPLGVLQHAGQGYLARRDATANEPLRLLSGHVFAGTLAIVAFGTYIGIAYKKANITEKAANVPALAFVLLFLIVACWGLSALAFFFDRYRFPLFWVLLILSAISWWVPQSDYFFRVEELVHPDPPTAAEYLATRLNLPGENTGPAPRRLIFVATPGGGIQAAAWTAEVLTELGYREPSTFRKSVAAISSVSGGSLGAIIYAASFTGEAKHDPNDVPRKALQSAIDEVAWGLTVPDFWRGVIPWLRIDRMIDRGWALEKKWGALNDLNDTGGAAGTMLSQWSEDARKGIMPALIVNSMIVERGQPIVFSTTKFPRVYSDSGRIVNFYDLYPGHDIRVNTAARLSASFPYVAPASRPSVDSPFGAGFHIVDGGYYDNFGMNSLLSWLDEGLADPKVKERLPEVLILQIRHFNPDKLGQPILSGWGLQLVAPLLGLYNMRDFAQNSVANNQLAFFGKYYRTQHVNVWKVSVEYDGTGDCAEAPLSWKLDSTQQDCIQRTWRDDVQVKQSTALACIKSYVNGDKDLAGKCSRADDPDKD